MRTVVLDASVLVACLFKDGRAREVLMGSPDVLFVVPPGIRAEARRQLPRIAARAGITRSEAEGTLQLLLRQVEEVSLEVLRPFEGKAREAASQAGDPSDWEYIALALALDAPIWTYDDDFDRVRGVNRVGTSALGQTH